MTQWSAEIWLERKLFIIYWQAMLTFCIQEKKVCFPAFYMQLLACLKEQVRLSSPMFGLLAEELAMN